MSKEACVIGSDLWLEHLRIAVIAADFADTFTRSPESPDSDPVRMMKAAEQLGDLAVRSWQAAHPIVAQTQEPT